MNLQLNVFKMDFFEDTLLILVKIKFFNEGNNYCMYIVITSKTQISPVKFSMFRIPPRLPLLPPPSNTLLCPPAFAIRRPTPRVNH